MISRLNIFLFLFLLIHSNCLNHLKRSELNMTVTTPNALTRNYPFTTELHKIIRWKSQPSFYTAPMEYQEIVTVPTTEEITTEKSTTVLKNITAQHWTPIFAMKTDPPLPDIPENLREAHELKEDIHKKDVENTKENTITNTTFQAILKNDTKEICPYFKYGKQRFDLEPMADVWQTAFFSLADNIQCFKLLIKKITKKEKKQFSKKYGNFNGVVNWAECNLQIWAAAQSNRKHFLQGLNEDDGIMDNIIIEEPGTSPETLAVIREESADQWLVYKNLLLLRDCEHGGTVVFSKVPYKASKDQIEEALKVFGESFNQGKMACAEDEDVSSTRYFYYDDDNNS